MNDYRHVTDACEKCILELPPGAPERIHEPVSALVDGDGLSCLYQCRQHNRIWATNWYLPALGAFGDVA